jgi:hypothetical protein
VPYLEFFRDIPENRLLWGSIAVRLLCPKKQVARPSIEGPLNLKTFGVTDV